MGRSTVHYADNQTNNILKALHNKLRPAGTPVQRVEYILELLLLRMFEVKLKREKEFIELRTLFNEENANQDKLFSHLLTLGSEQILPTLNKDFFPFYSEILKHARKVLAKNLNDSVIDQLVLIQEVFTNSNFTNNVQSGNLHDIIGLIEELDEACLLNSDLLGDAIESALSETGGTKDIGLFRTPDHIRHFMVGLVEPVITDTLIDPACGTGGFLFNAHEYVIERIQAPYRQGDDEPLFPGRKSHPELQAWFKNYLSAHPYSMPSVEQTHHFHRTGIYGIEYLGMIRKMAAVNFYVRHLNPANLQQGDSLDLFKVENHESKTLILANPPFGAKRDKASYANVWEDYPKESETTILFVKMMLDYLAVGGRCAVVVSEGFLTWEQGSARALRKMLLQENNLQAVIGLPQGVFVSKGGQGPKTSILLFAKGTPTQQVWFYNIENDGYSKGTNRTVTANCQLVEALSQYHDFVKHGNTPPETRRSFSLSVDWLNVVDPRIKAKIRAEVREKLTVKREEARQKLVVRLDKKLNIVKTAKPNSKNEVFTETNYQAEITQFEQIWEHKIQTEIAQAIDKAHLYSFNSSNYRSILVDSQLQAWDELVQHHKPDSNGHSLDQRYAALQQSSLADAIKHIAHFDPKNAIEADIVRGYVAAIAPEELRQYVELAGLDAIFKSGAKYPLVRLKDYLQLNTEKVKPKNKADISYKVLGVSNETGVFINEILKPEETNQSYFFVKKDQFCYNPYRINVGSIGLNRFDYDNQIISGAYAVFSADETRLSPIFLLALLKTEQFLAYVNSKANGGVRMNFEFEFLQDWEIPLPPIEVQQEIVDKIERQQALIEGVNKILKNWHIEQELFDNGHLTLLREIADIQRGKFSHRPRNDPKFYYGEYPFIQINDITNNFKFIKSSSQSLNELGIKVSKKFNSGTLVMSIASSIGEVGILTFDAYFPDSIVAIYPNESLVNKEYLFYYFKAFNNELIEQSSQAVQKNLNIDKLESFKIKIPAIEEQINIVSKLNNELVLVEKLEIMKTKAQAKIDKLINSIWESS